jgi:hypothetical protein
MTKCYLLKRVCIHEYLSANFKRGLLQGVWVCLVEKRVCIHEDGSVKFKRVCIHEYLSANFKGRPESMKHGSVLFKVGSVSMKMGLSS